MEILLSTLLLLEAAVVVETQLVVAVLVVIELMFPDLLEIIQQQ
jgi:hypothetical protein